MPGAASKLGPSDACVGSGGGSDSCWTSPCGLSPPKSEAITLKAGNGYLQYNFGNHGGRLTVVDDQSIRQLMQFDKVDHRRELFLRCI
jgi:hypothetical protein